MNIIIYGFSTTLLGPLISHAKSPGKGMATMVNVTSMVMVSTCKQSHRIKIVLASTCIIIHQHVPSGYLI